MSYLAVEAIDAAKRHARAEYPKESCGLVVNGEYIPTRNIARDPETHEEGNRDCGCRLCSFEIHPNTYLKASSTGKIQAILHSHPGGPLFPSQADMEGQIATNVPWGIIPIDLSDGDFRVGDPIMWGDDLPIPAILGREFMHGITDCYSMVRDTFRLGKEKLALQGIDGWPFDPITLPEVPRDDAWWSKEGQDLYSVGVKTNGFRQINVADVKPGDGFLMKVKSDKFNHAGLLISNDLIMHHLPTRLSRREPAGIWGRSAGMWVRFEGGHA